MPASWSELVARYGRANTRIFGATAAQGWPDGLVIPVHGPRGYRGIVSLAGETRDLPLRDRAALHLMSLYLHQRLMELAVPDLPTPADELPPLSRGEIECIKWLIAGKSDWEMSEILNIAEATAHWRIERAKKKFGVKTRAQLTAMAVHHGYIKP
jgi:DNA-binding CsgD family transcriptional regulator